MPSWLKSVPFKTVSKPFGGIFDLDAKKERLEEVQLELENPRIWSEAEKAQALGKERVQLEGQIQAVEGLKQHLQDSRELLACIIEEQDETALDSLVEELKNYTAQTERLEFKRMFRGPMDAQDAYLDIQAGSGGTEAQDWAQMLFRMYLRWCDQQGLSVDILEESAGEVVGLKSATLKITGDHAYGWLRTETGVHRLVRKSPFDANHKRHTSFAAVFVSPVVDDDISIEINPADLRIDTYRASGAGGQHVNRTDSAVRITHLPTGVVVQCQNDRSQHKNRAQAMSQLKAKLYEREMRARMAEQQALEATKSDIGWGSQIRSYVLDDSRIKDLRTGYECTHTQSVLDGPGLTPFIQSSLKSEF